MSEEILSFSKLGRLLPLDSIKDPGGKVSHQDLPSQKGKRKPQEESTEIDSGESQPKTEQETPSGKIVDILI